MSGISPSRWLLWPFEFLYCGFLFVRDAGYRRGWLRARRLPALVISVGNLTVGGTGKTPVVLRLAAWLQSNGLHVAVLTRGYGRRERIPMVINGRGDLSLYTPELMGDEPVLLARRVPDVTLGIGPDRASLAHRILILEKDAPPQVFLLDDGFQHHRLARDLDIVVIDASNPFDNGAVLPAGRLREPLKGLQRAGVIVLTRAGEEPCAKVTDALRRYNPHASVFRARTKLENFYQLGTHRAANLFVLKQQPALAFCGIGNPQAFWDDLACWGFRLAERTAFPDHYRYTGDDLAALRKAARATGAKAMLTTEKDAVNLTGLASSDMPVFYCRIDLEFDDEDGFFAAVGKVLRPEAD